MAILYLGPAHLNLSADLSARIYSIFLTAKQLQPAYVSADVITTLLADQKFTRHNRTVQFDNMLFSQNSTRSFHGTMRRASHAMSSRPKNSSTWTSKRKTLQMQQILLSLVRESTNTIIDLFISSTSLPHNLLLFMSSINSPKAVKHKRWIQTSAKSY